MTNEPIKRVAAVFRVSTQGQKHDDYDDSTDKQQKAAREWAASKGWEIISEYDEGAQSGADYLEDRPAIVRLISEAEALNLDGVIFYSPDRLARDHFTGMEIMGKLKRAGVRHVMYSQRAQITDLDDERDLIVASVETTGAQRDYKDIKAKTTKAKFDKAKATGKWSLGQKPPTGYRLDKNTGYLVTDEDEAALVHDIFKMIAGGAGTVETANEMQRKHGRNVSAGLVKNVIRRPEYRSGVLTRWARPEVGAEKQPLDFEVQAIVSDKLWNAANEEMDRHKHRPRAKAKRSGKERLYGLRGRVTHLHEGYGDDWAMNAATRVYRNKDKSLKSEVRVYHCYSAKTLDKAHPDRCQGFGYGSGRGRMTAHPADRLEADIILRALDYLSDPANLAQTRDDFLDRKAKEAGLDGVKAPDPAKRLPAIEKELAKLEGARDRAKALFVEGDLSRDEYDALKTSTTEKVKALRDEAAALTSVTTADDFWKRTLDALMPTPFDEHKVIAVRGNVNLKPGDTFGWTQKAQALRAEAQRVLGDKSERLSDDSIRFCERLADIFDVQVLVVDQGTDDPIVRVQGTLSDVHEEHTASTVFRSSTSGRYPFEWPSRLAS